MPITRVDYVPLPAVIPRRVVDTRTLGELLRQQGDNTLNLNVSRGNNAALLWRQLGQVFSNYAQGTRQDALAADALAQRKAAQDADDQIKRDELEQRKTERAEAERVRKEAEQRQQRMDAEKRGDAVAESVGYGPVSEATLGDLLQSPAQAARTRYSFGPGTAEGPELLPTRDQQALIDFKKEIEAKGGMVSPTGSAVMPTKAPAAKSLQRETAIVNGRPQFVNFNPDTGGYTDLQGNPVTPTPIPQREPTGQGATNQRIITIGNSFKSEPIVKSASTLASTMNFVNDLDPNTKNPADDQALIYAFAKAMDPDSVVREGEYATVQKYSQSLKDKFGFDIKRLFSNTPFLTPQARASLKTTIQARFEPMRKQYQGVFDEYVKRINKISQKEDGADYLTDYGVSFPAAPGQKKNPNR